MKTKICENCKKEYQTTWPKSRFCCIACKHAYIKRTWDQAVKEHPYLENEE